MEDRATRLKRLHMRSMRRGIKEMDLILSRFWAREGAGLSDGDPFEQANRLLNIERKLAIVTQDIQSANSSHSELRATVTRIEKMFEQLLLALSGQLKSEKN